MMELLPDFGIFMDQALHTARDQKDKGYRAQERG